jgi:thiol:disulfide interchange protein DsbD
MTRGPLATGLLALALGLLVACSSKPVEPEKSEQDDPLARVEMVLESATARPGGTILAAARFILAEGAHIYWRNPGDSGLPPEIRWTFPEGFQAGELQFPFPERIQEGDLVTFGYSRETLFPFVIKIPENARIGELYRFRADINWLVCKDICLPGDASVELEMTVLDSEPVQTPTHHEIARALERVPAPLPGWELDLLGQDSASMTFGLNHPAQVNMSRARIDLFPDQELVVEYSSEAVWTPGDGLGELKVKKANNAAADAPALSGVLVVRGATENGRELSDFALSF